MSDFKEFLKNELEKTNPYFGGNLQIQIGAKIKELRLKKKLSQAALSEMCGISQSKISQIENGTLNITIYTLEIIFLALGYKIRIVEEQND